MMKPAATTTVLVADDEELLRESIAFSLERKGFKVIRASNGREAFELTRTQPVDFIISDIRMPGGDGVELLDRVRAENPETPPFIFMTGFADITLEEAYDKGAEAIVEKPFNGKALQGMIERYLTPRGERWTTPGSGAASVNIELHFADFGQAIESKVISIGRGGMFVSLKDRFPAIGSSTNFKFLFDQEGLAPIQGDGIVRWVRRSGDHPPGCGIEFVSLDDKSREQVLQVIAKRLSRSFIPKAPR